MRKPGSAAVGSGEWGDHLSRGRISLLLLAMRTLRSHTPEKRDWQDGKYGDIHDAAMLFAVRHVKFDVQQKPGVQLHFFLQAALVGFLE